MSPESLPDTHGEHTSGGRPPGPRILVAGPSGCGKTTLAARIAERLDVPHTEIDALHHGPNWTPRPEFVADVHAFTAEDRWVTEWQYDQVRQHMLDRATLLVHLDLPRATVMQQVVRRTLRRRLRREQLWNGNVEPPLHTIFTDPEHIVRWSWDGIEKCRRKVAQGEGRPPGAAGGDPAQPPAGGRVARWPFVDCAHVRSLP